MIDKARVLAVNGGSSSLKFALYAPDRLPARLAHGRISGIGLAQGSFRVESATEAKRDSRTVQVPDHASAARLLMDWSYEQCADPGLTAVGHRVVHGGPKYCRPQRVTAGLLEDLRELTPFDPEHLPNEISLIEAMQRRFPDLPQIACFDTAFHHGMPRVGRMLAIPRRYEARGLQRYGFHGLSYAYLMQQLKIVAGKEAAQGRIVLAHLGNGASMAAVRDGGSIDTTMGFTPAAGLVMGTRSGDIDPGVVAFLARSEQMSAERFDRLINHESGLLGVSATSSDMQQLLGREAADERAAEAIALFCYQAKKWLGAYAAALGGLDTLVFSGGIGENAAIVRARICEGLAFLGIELDAERNESNAGMISTDTSRVVVRVIPTDEELMIATSVCDVLDLGAPTRQTVRGN